MVPYSTVGVDTAQPGTRVDAFLAFACSVGRAVTVNDTFGPTVGRGANHAREAGAVALTSPAVSRRIAVGPTRVGATGILLDNWCFSCKGNRYLGLTTVQFDSRRFGKFLIKLIRFY